MADRRPLVVNAGQLEQQQKADTLVVSTNAVSGAVRRALYFTDDAGNSTFELYVGLASAGNILLGVAAGDSISSGTGNVCIGASAGTAINTGSGNFCLGASAGLILTGVDNNILIGNNAGSALTSANNVGVGFQSLQNVTGLGNVGIGLRAGSDTTSGIANTFVGFDAGNNASQLVTASNSMALGNTSFTTANNQVMVGNGNVTQTILRGTVDIARSTNACRLNVYNTAAADPPGTSFELCAARWDSNIAKVGTHKGAGGGSARDFAIETDSVVRLTFGSAGDITVADTEDFIFSTGTGSKFGTAVTQKIGFWNVAPVVQPAAANQAALTNSTGGAYDGTLAAIGDTTAVDQGAALNNNFTDLHTLLNEIRTALVAAGLIKGAA